MSSTLRTLLWSMAGLLILAIAMSLQFRLPAGSTAAFAIDANLPRWLLGFSGGALLALAGGHMDIRTVSPLRFMLWSTGGVAGCVAGFFLFGEIGAVIGLIPGVMIGHLLARISPAHGYLPALVTLALAGIGLFLVSKVKMEPTLGRTLSYLAAGDTGQATLISGLIAVVLVIAVLALRNLRSTWLCLGLGVGLVGPLAFISWWVPLAEHRLTRLEGRARDVMVAFAGGVIVVSADAMQRWFIGGYGLGLNFPLALVGTPVWILWMAMQSAGWKKPGGYVLAGSIAVFAILFAAFTVNTIQSAT